MTSVRGPNVAASPTSGAVRGAKLIAMRAQLRDGTRARATVNENGLLRTRWAVGYRRSRSLPFSRPNTANPVARTRKRRMTKLPWKRPWAVFALRSTVGNRDPLPDSRRANCFAFRDGGRDVRRRRLGEPEKAHELDDHVRLLRGSQIEIDAIVAEQVAKARGFHIVSG